MIIKEQAMKLSKREEETENLLKQGLTQRQIAYKLKITRRTVREYIKRINQKKNQIALAQA